MHSASANIRRARQEDCLQLAAVEKESFSAGYSDLILSADEFQALVKSPDDAIFCYCVDGELQGYALLEIAPDRLSADFDSLAVAPSAQGKGIGEALFKYVEDYCRAESIPILNLRIKENNYRLLQRYHRFGYSIFEAVPSFYGDGSTALRMFKRL